MNTFSKKITLFAVFLFCIPFNSFAEPYSLSQKDVDLFIRDTPAFISSVKEKQMDELLIKLFLHPQQIHEDKVLVTILQDLSWDPERYAYIFSHVIIGGFIRDMGEFGDDKLEFMKEQRQKWAESSVDEEKKAEMLFHLDRSIIDLAEIVERTKRIPKKELLLFWKNRDRLNDILMGQLPIGKRKMEVLQ